MASRFETKTALVTGGSRGIGRAICELLAAQGARVAVNYRDREKEAAETVAAIEADGGQAFAIRADVADADQVSGMVREVTSTFGPIDFLVNNAGVFHLLGVGEITPENWRQTLDVNLTGTYLATWAVKDAMLERGFGRIVNLSSIGGLRPRARAIAYSVSKAGVIAFTKSCAEAWASRNVRVNAVAPGLIDTEMIGGAEPELLDKLTAETPLGRIGTPTDVASVVAFLLSEESGFMTGQTLVVCGGRVMIP
ncbi:MAG: 3-oxoacyl-ACP reductase FabG [Planctomycetes bacterium]|nr:3-oxoacyl-ACP reductase FabG [Planctomycetota bacterium]